MNEYQVTQVAAQVLRLLPESESKATATQVAVQVLRTLAPQPLGNRRKQMVIVN